MRIALLLASVVIGAGFAIPTEAWVASSSGSKVAQNADGPSCYCHKFSGLYKTFSPGDFTFVPDWRFVHRDACQCEGQTGDVCQEPGDNG
jgi:hypothetical protein